MQITPWSCAWNFRRAKRNMVLLNLAKYCALEKSPPHIRFRFQVRFTMYKTQTRSFGKQLLAIRTLPWPCKWSQRGENHRGFSLKIKLPFILTIRKDKLWFLTSLLAHLSWLLYQGGRWSWKLSALISKKTVKPIICQVCTALTAHDGNISN